MHCRLAISYECTDKFTMACLTLAGVICVCVSVIMYPFFSLYVDATSNTVEVRQHGAEICAVNFFLSLRNNVSICSPCAVCPSGHETAKPCTAVSNTTCNKCTEGTFSPGNGNSCMKCSECPPGNYRQRNCSESADTVCLSCEKDTFFSRKKQRCITCRQCPAGKYEKRKCSRWRNTKCRGCRKGHFSPLGKTCQPCRSCPPGSELKESCTKTTNAECEACPDGMFSAGGKARCQKCTVCSEQNKTKALDCSTTKDTLCLPCPKGFYFNNVQCLKCSVCRGGQILHEECTDTSDTVCGQCPPSTYSSRDRSMCLNCTTCPPGWVQQMACSKSRNRKCVRCHLGTFASNDGKRCMPCTYCPAGTETKKACTSKNDTKCKKCQRGYYSPGYGFSCRMCSLCPPGMYVARACARRRDTICKPCVEGTFTGTWSSSPSCAKCGSCPPPTVVMRNCDIDRNVHCGLCRPGQFRDDQTARCVQCSYCYPERPGLAVREGACWREPEDFQCRPLDFNNTANLTYQEFRNLTDGLLHKPPTQSDQMYNLAQPATHGGQSVRLSADDDPQTEMVRQIMIIVPTVATGVIVIMVAIVFILHARRCKSQHSWQRNHNTVPASNRSAPPAYSFIMASREVRNWLQTQSAGFPVKSLGRNSWPAVRCDDCLDPDKLSVVSDNVLNCADMQRRLEERVCQHVRLYPKAHSVHSDSLPASSVI